ncbi:MAG TPA: phosphoribosylformylglycinamidine cyclo-ligase [Longimicrobiaceae bacterium]|nr:phosphoribosylformylglycinamidine cyclo-ligase [Longimicrobiaceae bacterium]
MAEDNRPELAYRDAGVDIDAANRARESITSLVESTRTPGTLSGVGSFGGLFRVPGGIKSPVLVASTDGVGTKLKLAFLTGKHDTVGEDLVNHCVNDILVQGASPLFFLDYIGMGHLEPGTVEALVAGMARGCRNNGCALLGGETAEMPDFYTPGEYDLAGTIVGAVAEDRILDGSKIKAGDVVIGIASSGLHTNGYSLARRVIFDELALTADSRFPDEEGSVAEVLMRVHRSYLPALRPILQRNDIRGLAHITGGGLLENVPRILPDGLAVRIDVDSWEVPSLFRVIQAGGNISEREMYRAFNMGVGMIAVTTAGSADSVVRSLQEAGESAWVIGSVLAGDGDVLLS